MKERSEYETSLTEMFSLRRFGIKLGLETIRSMLNRMDNPHNRYSIVHVAGTNGKGSVASALATVLRFSGYRTGLFTSPHLVRFNERIQVDGREIADESVIETYKAVKAAHQGGREPTFFEFNTAMAFYEFARRKVDWAVVETGMGGRLDATNVVMPALSIVTNISLEHKTYLGGTIAKIAFEKAGIVKPGVPVVTGVRQRPAIAEVQKAAEAKGASMFLLGRDFSFRRNRPQGTFSYRGLDTTLKGLRTSLAGEFQAVNASLVCAACEVLRRQRVPIPDSAIVQGLLENRWPGRLEKVSERPLIILDGAHNLASARALRQYMEGELAGRRITLVTGVLNDKPYRQIMADLCRPCRKVILTRPRIDRALPPETLEGTVRRFVSEVTVTGGVAQALDLALQTVTDEEVVVVAGSLYVVGEAKEYFERKASGLGMQGPLGEQQI